jgi:hypothetical protein
VGGTKGSRGGGGRGSDERNWGGGGVVGMRGTSGVWLGSEAGKVTFKSNEDEALCDDFFP